MPPLCEGAPECDGTNTRVWATHLDSIRLGDVMTVPMYRWVPLSLACLTKMFPTSSR